MQTCPKCGRPVDKESSCASCGPGPKASDPKASKRPKPSRLPLFLIAFAICGIGSLMLIASATRSPAPPPNGDSPVRPAAAKVTVGKPPAARPAEAPRSRPAQRWTASRLAVRAQPDAYTFELVADHDVPVWQSLVRPVLIVRCLAKTTEVFVVTKSAAAIERDTRQHTIRLRFDDHEEVPQMWEHSVGHDALFAPDGSAVARQIAGADRMSFTFTPFNAQPTVVKFNVVGFDAQLRPAARRACGWKAS